MELKTSCSEPASGPSQTPKPAGADGSWRRLWGLFILAIVGSFFVHELGHCAVAWIHGYAAIPTPMKEYVLHPLPPMVQNQVALGGIAGSVAVLLGMVVCLNRRPGATRSALVAGGLTPPGFYTLRFILFGRGHDATEFQEAQAALGLTYGGHAVDWLFLGIFVLVSGFWFWRIRPRLSSALAGRLVGGAVVALMILVLVQSVNNALFDALLDGPR